MRFWRNGETEHVETELTNKSAQAKKDAQSKKKHHKKTFKFRQ